jgi:large subunit ribosomal protein L9
MKVILMERVEKLGLMGDIVTVKPGYARNYLLPQKKALRASAENLADFESRRQQLEADNLKQREEANAVGARFEGLAVMLIRQAGDSGQLYGSVTARDLAQAITEAGFTVDRKQVVLDKAIKVLGLHQVKIRLHPEVVVEVTANVARSEAEAERQVQTGHMVSAEEQRETEEAAVEAIVAEVEESDQAEAPAADEAEAASPPAEESEAESRA